MSNKIGPEGISVPSDPDINNTIKKKTRQGGILAPVVRFAGSLGIAAASILSPVNLPFKTEADTGEKLTQNGVELTLLHPAKWDQVQPDRQIGVGIYRQNRASLDLAKRVAQDYFFTAKPLDEFRDKFFFVDINFTSGNPDFGCDQTAYCTNQELIRTTRRNVEAATGFRLQERIVLIGSESSGVGGSSSTEVRNGARSLDTDAWIVMPEQLIHDDQKTVVPHEVGTSFFAILRNEESNSVANSWSSNDRGPNFGTRQSQIIKVLLSGNPVIPYLTPNPELNIVPTTLASLQGETKLLSTMDVVAGMTTSLGTTEVKWWVYPAANIYTGKPDGPAIEMKYGDPVLIHALGEAGQRLPAPEMGKGNYIFLPDTTYTIGFSISGANTPLEWGSSRWGEIEIYPDNYPSPYPVVHKIYIPPKEGKFRTPIRDATTITHETHKDGHITNSKTPTLTWNNTKTDVFYYEVQISKDPNFSQEPGSPFLYSELVHGGLTTPLNSYRIPQQYPLEAGTTYYWRVRPRIQADGTPVKYPKPSSFRTSSDARILSAGELEIITEPTAKHIITKKEHERNMKLAQAEDNTRLIPMWEHWREVNQKVQRDWAAYSKQEELTPAA